MSFTFLAKSSAYSWNRLFAGQLLCQRIAIAPWARAIAGAASAVAPAAPAALRRNLRRESVLPMQAGCFADGSGALFARMPAEQRQHHQESDDIGKGDVPAVRQPATDGFCFRIHVG